jgi:diguanylate cyclase (GGDEF)-like protein
MGDIEEPDISGLRKLEETDIRNDDPKLRPDSVPIDEYLEQQRHAQTDVLTGLPNDRRFAMDIKQIISKGERNLAFFFIDINNLKEINDFDKTHALGDYIIVRTADVLRENTLVQTDLKYRFGKGDEFVLISKGVKSAEDMEKIGQRLVNIFSGGADKEERQLPTACIGGIWMGANATDDEVKAAIFGADKALYEAKARATTAYMTSQGRKPSCFVAFNEQRHGLLSTLMRSPRTELAAFAQK